jgi:hypothetical protein
MADLPTVGVGRNGRVWLDAYRARAGAAAAVRGGEGLVEVHVHGVETHVARPADAHEGIEVGSVVVEERPGCMHHLGYIQYLSLEQAQGVGVRQHEGRRARRELRFQVGKADPPVMP